METRTQEKKRKTWHREIGHAHPHIQIIWIVGHYLKIQLLNLVHEVTKCSKGKETQANPSSKNRHSWIEYWLSSKTTKCC